VTQHAADAPGAASALYLLADLATDDGRDAAARSAWRELVTKYPSSTLAPTSAFKAALIAYITGDFTAAATEWDAAAAAFPRNAEAPAMRYWAGRAHARRGDNATARARWQSVVDGTTTSYYAVLAARRLGAAPWTPAAADDTPPTVPMVDSAMARIALLDSLGMSVESGHERSRLLERVEGNADAMLAAGAAFRNAGESSRAIALGLKVAEGGRRDARTYRLIYPLLHRESLITAAARARLDPALVAALVRQESSFNPRAVSPVGARGLMQLMPTVGRSIARSRNYPIWDDALLLEPTVSFDLGTAHLAGDLSRQRDLTRALAAYNAGAARVTRWVTKAGVADPEVFAERIPYVETRDYVRIVQRNVVMYKALYSF
nr:transglycosylase SLT domain-containing protein [Gemmatimonadaceae bacterium]